MLYDSICCSASRLYIACGFSIEELLRLSGAGKALALFNEKTGFCVRLPCLHSWGTRPNSDNSSTLYPFHGDTLFCSVRSCTYVLYLNSKESEQTLSAGRDLNRSKLLWLFLEANRNLNRAIMSPCSETCYGYFRKHITFFS